MSGIAGSSPTGPFDALDYPNPLMSYSVRLIPPRNHSMSAFLPAIVTFLLALLAVRINEFIKRVVEKSKRISLFQAEIRRNWKALDAAGAVPAGDVFTRVIFSYRGIDGLDLTGQPEYDFEVCNVKLFETEGVALAQQLSGPARRQFWEVFALIRDAETVRKVLSDVNGEAVSKADYRPMFKALVTKLGHELHRLNALLDRESRLFA